MRYTYSLFIIFFSRILRFLSHFLISFSSLYFLYTPYLLSGDIFHGYGSYFLIMHSTLASCFKIIWIIYVIELIIFLYIHHYHNSYYNYYIMYLIILNTSIYNLIHSVIFLMTGVVWGDYAWGFAYSIEFRFLNIVFLFLLYSFFIIIALLGIQNIHILVQFTSIYVLLFLLLTIFLYIYDIPIINHFLHKYLYYFGISMPRYEFHQSDSSMHLLLISLSGYYMHIIFIYLIYYLLSFTYMFIVLILHWVLVGDNFFYLLYKNSFQTHFHSVRQIFLSRNFNSNFVKS